MERQAVVAGLAAALLGYSSSVAVVVTGLSAVGATAAQVSSALLALGIAMGALTIGLSARTHMPVAVVWTTPGLALLATTGTVDGGFAAVVGALVLTGVLIALTGLVRPLVAALQRLPAPLTAAVLGGVLLPFCLAPARAVADLPLQAGLIAAAWAVATWRAPRWAAPVALLALLAVVGLQELGALPASASAAGARATGLLPTLELATPALSLEAVTAVALPLYLVTMAAQNLVGLAVLQTAGYRPPVGTLLVATGAGSALAAPLGAVTVNLAAITGALTAGPDAHPDPARRWTAAATAGAANLLLGALAPLTAGVVTGSDARLVTTAAGLALVPALATTLAAALGPDSSRTPATVTLVVAASGITGAAPLGLLAGGVLLRLTRRSMPPSEPG